MHMSVIDADVIAAIASLAWPVLAGGVLWRLWPILRDLVQSRSFRIKVGGMEISVQQATEQLRVSVEDLQARVDELRRRENRSEGAGSQKVLRNRRVMWVDDVPENNAYEIARLREDGVEVVEVTSTRGAVRRLLEEAERVELVVSDMGREEGKGYNVDAGLDLISALRAGDFRKPIYVYCSFAAAERVRDRVRDAGGEGTTSSELELFEIFRREGVLSE